MIRLCWAKAASYRNDSNKDFRIIVNRDNQCPLRKSTLEAIHKQNLKVSVKTYNVKNSTLLVNKHNNKNKILYPLTFEDLCELKQYWVEYSDYLVIESCFYQLNNLIKSKKSKSIEHGCRAGRFYMAISARNEFLPCPHVNIPQKNIASIEEYWNYNEELNSMRQILKSNLQNGCQECISKENCSYCLCEMYGNSISNAYNCLLYQKKEG